MALDPKPGVPPSASPTRDPDRLVSELFQSEYHALVRLASLVLNGREAAEEVVQDAFVKLYRKSGRIKDPSRADAYLRSIVMNGARSKLRRREVARRHRPEPPPDAKGADVDVMMRDESRHFLDAIQALPERQADCIILRFYEELTEADTADTLGISRSTVNTHVERGLDALATVLEDDDE
ncbi:MAG: sigma-70 family RNA polymerase sigma factor [Acidimicrobiia bacterium]|nr:sigma-70 family RNA polymerase sigma factor [Acidimicrobiia bacterium]